MTSGSPSRGWAFTGVVSGLAGLASIAASMNLTDVYDKDKAGSADKIVAGLADSTTTLLVFHTATMIATVTVLVFAAGLRRRLMVAQTEPGSLLPDVAAGGLFLVAVAGLMGSGLDTEFIFGLKSHANELVPEVGAFYGHWINTIPWLWVGAGLTGVTVAVAALRQGAAPRWLGWVCAVLGGLTLLVGISPLQYLAGFPGPVLVLITSAYFAFGDERRTDLHA